MDADVVRWSLEFLSRQKRMDFTKTLIRTMVGSSSFPFPLSQESFLNKKSVIIDVLQEEVENASIAEHMLQKLEVLEEFYRLFGFPIPATMAAAYCAIAVECTLKYLIVEPSPSKNRAYLSAIDRIWRGRVRLMKPSAAASGSKMFTAELKRWSYDIEASLRDPQVMERLRKVDSRREAIDKVKAFLEEASDETSPSFLEFMASLPNRDEDVVPIVLPTHTTDHQMDLDSHTTVKDMNCEHPMENQSTDAQIENQITDAPIENQCADVPFDNQRTDAPNENIENQRTDAPNENQSVDVDSHEQHVCQTTNNNDVDDLTKTTTSHQSDDVNRPSLMVRNNTARTCEWDSFVQWEESRVGLQGATSNHASKIHLPSPKRKEMSPLKPHEPGQITKRRRPKKWSDLEEETLKTAVERIGEGNWKSILEAHREIFVNRTQVDLKDKWRNLTRYGAK